MHHAPTCSATNASLAVAEFPSIALQAKTHSALVIAVATHGGGILLRQCSGEPAGALCAQKQSTELV